MMGGCGGKKRREKDRARLQTGTATIGGQFNSTGNGADQKANLALVTRLLGEIGQDGERRVSSNDRLFLQDVRVKMNQSGSGATFGWRQVAKMVAIHKAVVDAGVTRG